nr:trafficking protein particle complex subunit 11 [Ipomoea batatas]
MVSELAGEGAVPPQLSAPASHAELRIYLRQSIRRASLLSRQYVNPLLDSELDFFVHVANKFAYATGEVIRNLSAVLFKSNQSSVSDDSWSRSMKNTSKVLVNVLFAELVDPSPIAIPGADLWKTRAMYSLVINDSWSRSMDLWSRVIVVVLSPQWRLRKKKQQAPSQPKTAGDDDGGGPLVVFGTEKVLRLVFTEELMERSRDAGVSEVMIAAGLYPGPRSFHGLIVSHVLNIGVEEGAMQILAPKRGDIVRQISDALKANLHYFGRRVGVYALEVDIDPGIDGLVVGVKDLAVDLELDAIKVGVAVYGEFRRDWGEALKTYDEAYHVLREIVGTSTTLPNLVGAPEVTFLHWEWLSKQSLVFAELLETSYATNQNLSSAVSDNETRPTMLEKINLPGAIFTIFCGGADIGQTIAMDTHTSKLLHSVNSKQTELFLLKQKFEDCIPSLSDKCLVWKVGVSLMERNEVHCQQHLQYAC